MKITKKHTLRNHVQLLGMYICIAGIGGFVYIQNNNIVEERLKYGLFAGAMTCVPLLVWNISRCPMLF